MLIDDTNVALGNGAIAAILLLYYHLLIEGGITNDQTVFLSDLNFDPFEFLSAVVAENHQPEINQELLREGAAVHLLCDLNDIIQDYEDDYLLQPGTDKYLNSLQSVESISEIKNLLTLIRGPLQTKAQFDKYRDVLHKIYRDVVVAWIENLASKGT